MNGVSIVTMDFATLNSKWRKTGIEEPDWLEPCVLDSRKSNSLARCGEELDMGSKVPSDLAQVQTLVEFGLETQLANS